MGLTTKASSPASIPTTVTPTGSPEPLARGETSGLVHQNLPPRGARTQTAIGRRPKETRGRGTSPRGGWATLAPGLPRGVGATPGGASGVLEALQDARSFKMKANMT